MRCDVNYEDGCRNMPTQDDILIHYPHHRHEARQFKFSLIAIQRYYIQGYTFVKVLTSAKKRLDGHCTEFTRIFFHEATHHKEQKCPEDIINIVVQVLMAIFAIYFLVVALIDLVVWVTKALAETALRQMLRLGAAELLKSVTRGLPAGQMVGEAGSMVPVFGKVIVPAVTDTALLVADGGAQISYLANSVAASTAELTFDTMERIAQLAKIEAAQAAKGAADVPANVVDPLTPKPLTPVKSRPKVPVAKKPSPTPPSAASKLGIYHAARIGVESSLYQDVAESLLRLPTGSLNQVDLLTKVGPDALGEMLNAHIVEDQIALTRIEHILQKTKLTPEEPPKGSGSREPSDDSPSIPQYDGTPQSNRPIADIPQGPAGDARPTAESSTIGAAYHDDMQATVNIYDTEVGKWKQMEREEFISYHSRQYGLVSQTVDVSYDRY
jgi:hypothetical protein